MNTLASYQKRPISLSPHFQLIGSSQMMVEPYHHAVAQRAHL